MISIDIDEFNVERLYITLWKGKNLGLNLEEVRISPSGYGFQVIYSDNVPKEKVVQVRALLDDDPYRLRYALKRLALGSTVDICFSMKKIGRAKTIWKKNGKKLINIDEIFSCKSVEEVAKLAEKSSLKEFEKKYYVTAIGLSCDYAILDRIKQICEDTNRKDETFKFKIYPSFFEKYDYVLVVFSANKDQAYQRGEWLKKVFLKELGLDVLYWVKERKEKPS